MIDGINASKNIPFEKVLFALGIRYVGETVAKKLARHFKKMDNLIAATFEDLIAVDEFGEIIAKSVHDFLRDQNNLDLIRRLKDHGLKLEMSAESQMGKTDKLKGKTFVVSGLFEIFSRNELKKSIEDNGGKISSSISKKTSYVIAGDSMGPSKRAKAEELKVEIISEKEYLKML